MHLSSVPRYRFALPLVWSRVWPRIVFALALVVAALAAVPARGQTDGLLQIGDPMHRFLERQKTAGHLPGAFVSTQPLSAYEAHEYLDTLAVRADSLDLTRSERAWLAQLRGEAAEPGVQWARAVWGRLYPNGQDLAAVSGDGYALQANPLLYARVGRAQRTADLGGTVVTWRNTRGARVSGHVGPVFFESRLTENQERPARFQFDDDTAPRLGFVLRQPGNVYDYFTATGVIGVRSKFFEVRFGRTRNRWGYGRGSAMLSNYGPPYEQLQVRTSFWRLQYTNLFARFTDKITPEPTDNDRGGNNVLPRRYGAFHRLTLQVTDRLEVQLHEGIVLATQEDSTVQRTGFDLAYLNPVIFYRALERDQGSPDNAMIGIGASWIVTSGLQAYGHFLLDELRVSEIGSGWWGNKWGWVLGTHLTKTGVNGLDVRAEVARQRPFLYAHFFQPNAFLHYNDPVGHPVAPNSVDASVFLRYDPPGRWTAAMHAAYTWAGRNPSGTNLGADPRLSTRTRSRDYVALGEGVRQDRWTVEAFVGWEVLPDLVVEASVHAEAVDDAVRGTSRYVMPGMALRWGLPFDSLRY